MRRGPARQGAGEPVDDIGDRLFARNKALFASNRPEGSSETAGCGRKAPRRFLWWRGKGKKGKKGKDDGKGKGLGANSEAAERERRKMDENYDRAKKGFSVLKAALKILKHIPVVKKFFPSGADKVAEAAETLGNKLSSPKDGMIIGPDGEIKVWNPKTKKWENF